MPSRAKPAATQQLIIITPIEEPALTILVPGPGECTQVLSMSQENSTRVGEYLSRATTLRTLASKTRYPEVRQRLLGRAASFERLADQVEQLGNTLLATAAD